MGKKNMQYFPTPEEDPRFHDTYQFLHRYRDATYSLKVVVHQLETQFQTKYGSSIDDFLDFIYAAGVELGGSKIEERAKSIEHSNKMLKLLASSVDLLRTSHKYGEQYYWILYYAFLSPHEQKNAEEILEKLEPHIDNISYRCYYRKRRAAIEILSTILWGFTAKETINILNQFFSRIDLPDAVHHQLQLSLLTGKLVPYSNGLISASGTVIVDVRVSTLTLSAHY